MKDKVRADIKSKAPKLNLQGKTADALVDAIVAKVGEDESQIDAIVNDFLPFISEIAKRDDQIRSLKAAPKSETPPKEDPKDPPADPPADDTPAWAKKLMDEVSILRGEKARNEIRSKITEKLKDVPEKFWIKRSLPEREEDIETFVTDVSTDFTDFHQGLVDKGLAIKPPKSGSAGGSAGGKETASKEELDSLAKQIL